jgi:hypothetical protein
MSTLSNLQALGWVASDDFAALPCDVCGERATFVRMTAPDCATWGLAGVGGAHSDAYGVYCSPECNRREALKEVAWARGDF